MTSFWDTVNQQLTELESSHDADDVLRILSPERNPYGPAITFAGEGFFAGSGGDRDVHSSLYAAGWESVWYKAPYFWCMERDGTAVTYIEGCVYRGNVQEPPPECNEMFCVLDACVLDAHVGNRHTDVTGYSWYEETPDEPVIAHIIQAEEG